MQTALNCKLHEVMKKQYKRRLIIQ